MGEKTFPSMLTARWLFGFFDQLRRLYSVDPSSPLSSPTTSGDFNGSSPSQSKHRNLRPPVLTSVNRIGLPHLRHRGGGVFLAMALTLNWAGAQHSQSPVTAEARAVISHHAPSTFRIASLFLRAKSATAKIKLVTRS